MVAEDAEAMAPPAAPSPARAASLLELVTIGAMDIEVGKVPYAEPQRTASSDTMSGVSSGNAVPPQGPKNIKWGRVYDHSGGQKRVIIIQYRGNDRPDVGVRISAKAYDFGGETCKKSLHDSWPVWFCVGDRVRGRTLVYLLQKDDEGMDDEATRGGLIADAPFTGFVAWGRLTLHAEVPELGDLLHMVRQVVLDLADEQLSFFYMDGRGEARIGLQRPVNIQGAQCMGHFGPLLPLFFCTNDQSRTLRIYTRVGDAACGDLLAEVF